MYYPHSSKVFTFPIIYHFEKENYYIHSGRVWWLQPWQKRGKKKTKKRFLDNLTSYVSCNEIVSSQHDLCNILQRTIFNLNRIIHLVFIQVTAKSTSNYEQKKHYQEDTDQSRR